MKMFCISDSLEPALGLKLSGVESSVLKDKTKIDKKIDEILENSEIGILVVTDNVYKISLEKMEDIKKHRRLPLIVKI